MKSLKHLIIPLLLLMAWSVQSQTTLNVDSVGHLNYLANASDVWGYVAPDSSEYAIMGVFNGTAVIDLSDPSDPEEFLFVDGANSTWRDMATWDEYIFAVADVGSDGLLIIDMADAPDSAQYKFWQPMININGVELQLRRCHNMWIDEDGYAYLSGCNLNSGGVLIVDIHSDPWEPEFVAAAANNYSHDNFVRDSMLYSAEIYQGQFSVQDVTDRTNPVLVNSQNTSSSFTHNCWLSDDGDYIFTTDEVANAYIDAYDISDILDIEFVSSFRTKTNEGEGVIPHNVHYHEGFLVISYYTDGVVIVDAHRPENMVKVGQFPTFSGSPGGFNGCWGAYPYLPSGLILASDIQSGLFVLDPDYKRASYLEGKVTSATTGANIPNVEVEIQLNFPNGKTTGADGNYKTGIPEEGFYDVTFSHPDYRDTTIEVELEREVVTILDVALFPPDCNGPQTQADQLEAERLLGDEIQLNWVRGDGDQVIGIARKGDPVNRLPEPGNLYTSDAEFGMGDHLGQGNYVVYAGSGTNFSVTCLDPNLDYHFAFLEYDTTDLCYLYPPLENSFTTLGLTADLQLEKTVDGNDFQPGDTIHFELSISNLGPEASGSIALIDNLPSELSYINADPSPDSTNGNSIFWTLESLNSGDSINVNLETVVDSQPVVDTFYNMAIVSGEASDPDSTNNIDSVQIAIDCNIDSCNDITISTEVDQCGAVVDYNFSNCNIPSGSFFPVGTTTVNCEVTNSCGQTDSCSFEVTVIDSVPPVIDDCPQNLTIVACELDAFQDPSFSDTLTQSSYSQFSDSVNQGSAQDNCGIKSVAYVDSLSGECTFEIHRTWVVADSFENQSQCQQLISIQPDSLTLVCPQDTTITQCPDEQAISDLFWDWVDEAQMNGGCQADLVNDATEPPGICGGDSTVTFTAVDSCGQSVECSATFGVQEPPAINAICPADTVLFVDENCSFDLSEHDLGTQIEGDCDISLVEWEISGDTTLSGNNSLQNINLEKGTYLITWSATGLCDETDCDFQLSVQDNQSPEITCPAGIDSLVLAGEDGLLLSLDSAVAWDNCRVAEVSNSFNQGGADASGFYEVGNTEITFIATDNSGNSATCQTLIQIGVDSQDVELQIAGVVETAFDVPVNNVSLEISGDKQKNAMTDSDGSYDFLFDFGDSLFVVPDKSGGWLDGVTTIDLIFIQRHILQVELFTLPYQHISADANNDGEITTLDLVVLQGLILGNTDTLAGNKSWRFIPEDFDFDNPNNPLNEDWPEDKNYPGINGNLLEEDWVAVKTGDVSGDAGLLGIRETPISHDLELQEIRHPDQVIEWQIITSESDPLNGYQLEWEFPVGELEFTGWVNHLKTEDGTTMDGFYIDEESGIIRVLAYSGKKAPIADDGLLLSLFFESQVAAQAVLELVERGDKWESEVYLKDGREIRLPRVKETRSVDEETQFRLLQNRPNPFTAETTIGFILPQAGDYELSVTSSAGKLIRQIEGEGKAGKNQLQLNLEDLTPGVYLYRLSSGKHSAVKKMLVH